MFDKLNKLSLPATILVASLLLGAFYFATQVIKQNSIERQQQTELQARTEADQLQQERESSEKLDRMFCVDEAKEAAKSQYKDVCSYDCKKGYYYTANYDNYYNTCLQRKGLN